MTRRRPPGRPRPTSWPARRTAGICDGTAAAGSGQRQARGDGGVGWRWYPWLRRARPPPARPPKNAEASYYTIQVGDRVVEAGAWYYPDPLPDAPPIKDLIAFYWGRMDHWFEEDEEVFVHPRDPYHRVDLLRSDRHVRVLLDGE